MKYLLFAVSIAIMLLISCAPATTTETTSEKPTYTLWFDAANRVHRTVIQNEDAWQPTWVIVQDGDVVLEQTAVGEPVYQYFKDEPGIYTIYLKAWTGERYEVVSNLVFYTVK